MPNLPGRTAAGNIVHTEPDAGLYGQLLRSKYRPATCLRTDDARQQTVLTEQAEQSDRQCRLRIDIVTVVDRRVGTVRRRRRRLLLQLCSSPGYTHRNVSNNDTCYLNASPVVVGYTASGAVVEHNRKLVSVGRLQLRRGLIKTPTCLAAPVGASSRERL